MKLFLDTANVDEIAKADETGMLNGITTNPSLIAKTGKKFLDVVSEITNIISGPVSVEAVADNAEDMVAKAKDIIAVPC